MILNSQKEQIKSNAVSRLENERDLSKYVMVICCFVFESNIKSDNGIKVY